MANRNYYMDAAEPGNQGTPKEKGSSETTLIPKSMCPGMKVGDSLQMKIVGSSGQEYQVEYVKPEMEEPETETMPEEPSEEYAPPAGTGAMMM